MKLSEYVLLSREERTAHIDLTSPCTCKSRTYWTRHPQWEFFGIEDDVPHPHRGKIIRAHLCENHTNCGGKVCHNPLHFYIGTQVENLYDIDPELRKNGGYACKGVKHSKPKSAEHRRKLSIAQSKHQQKLRDEQTASH